SSVCSTQVAAIAQPLTPSASTSLKFPSTASSGEWLLIQGCENVAVPFWSWTGTAAAGTAARTQISESAASRARDTSVLIVLILRLPDFVPQCSASKVERTLSTADCMSGSRVVLDIAIVAQSTMCKRAIFQECAALLCPR